MNILVKVSLVLLLLTLSAPASFAQSNYFNFSPGAAATDVNATAGTAGQGSVGSVNNYTSDVTVTANNQNPTSEFGVDQAYISAPSNSTTGTTQQQNFQRMTQNVPSGPFQPAGKVQTGLLAPLSILQFGDMRSFGAGPSGTGPTIFGSQWGLPGSLPSTGLSPCNGLINSTTDGYQ